MKLVSRFEAAALGTDKLHGLLAKAFKAAAHAPRGSQQRRNALLTIDNVRRELAARTPGR